MTTERHRQKIDRELPPTGTTLTGRFKGQTYSATIVEAEDSCGDQEPHPNLTG